MPFTHELTSSSYNTFGYTGGGNSCVSSYTAQASCLLVSAWLHEAYRTFIQDAGI